MNIYFTASTSNNGQFQKHNQKIVSIIKKLKHKLISGQQIINTKLLEKDKSLPKKEIFKKEKILIEKCDALIAEVSQPSLGVGGEIVYALIKEKPVLALIFEKYQDKLSPMIAGNPSDNLFLENYNFDKLPYLIKDFLSHVKNLKKRKGFLIVIDGGDGSGKTTQAQLLVQYLQKKKILVKYFNFPQYYTSFHGKTVAKFLRGEFGSINQVSPYLISLAFALDRVSVKKEMEDFLQKGGIIIANRYVSSNIAHQGAKFSQKKNQEDFLKWVSDLEYKVHKIPKENLVIYLYVPWQISLKLTAKKGNQLYLQGKTDIHEKDLVYRAAVEKMYLYLSQKYKHWVKINCVNQEKILPPEIIHKEIIQILIDKRIL